MAASEEESEAVQTDEMDQWKPEENKEETEEQQNTAKPMSREMKNTLAAAVENVLAEQAAASEEPEKPEKPSQSGLGITQDLAKEITAIFEAEKREQLKERQCQSWIMRPERSAMCRTLLPMYWDA